MNDKTFEHFSAIFNSGNENGMENVWIATTIPMDGHRYLSDFVVLVVGGLTTLVSWTCAK